MNNKYTISEFVSTGISYILTKLFDRNARLIRRPVYIRGKKNLQYKKGFTTGHGCRFDLKGDSMARLTFGENCELGDAVHIVAHDKVSIGNNVLMASKIFISDTSHGEYSGEQQDSPFVSPNQRPLRSRPVFIGDNVWIGENVVILPGVKIGSGSIIGANSVVNQNIAENSIAVGSPAKVIKKYDKSSNMWEKIEER
uniref:Putative O-acetyltransferase n=1 Tax=Streptococcus suis TaxID=1307 RepID=M1V3T8_STRSU|nr:putative O-acetyltransferase [Streptococcus suis]